MKVLNRTYTGKYAPNHLEYDYWIDLTADPKGSIIKTFNGKVWEPLKGFGNESDDDNTPIRIESEFDPTSGTLTLF